MSEQPENLTVCIDPATADQVIVRDDGFPIGVAYDTGILNQARERAHLWAAAPALRDALRWAVEYMEQYEGEVMPGWREFQARGRAALAASALPPTADAGSEDGAPA